MSFQELQIFKRLPIIYQGWIEIRFFCEPLTVYPENLAAGEDSLVEVDIVGNADESTNRFSVLLDETKFHGADLAGTVFFLSFYFCKKIWKINEFVVQLEWKASLLMFLQLCFWQVLP